MPVGWLAQLIAAGAKLRPTGEIPNSAEPRYRPSTALEEFIRMRDLTCRFPNCDVPAHHCDIDHRIPWPAGPTHPSNLRALCRKHHLLRTFQGGPHGWRDIQQPDATIIWTAPTGHTYTTTPASKLWFPSWNTTTAPLPDPRSPITPTAPWPCPDAAAPAPTPAPTESDANAPSTTPASPNATDHHHSDVERRRTVGR